MITQDELDGVKTILSMKEARILQLEQELAAATERAAGLEQDYRGLLHKADSWERGMEWNAQLCAEKDARIAELEAVHLVEDGDLPTDNQMILWTDGEHTYVGGVDTFVTGDLWWANDSTATDAVAWMTPPDLLALAAQKRARRATEAAAGTEAK